MTREEFERLVEKVAWAHHDAGAEAHRACKDAILGAWDAQAAEVERLRAEVHRAAPDREPLTQENAPRARVVECLVDFVDGCFWTAEDYPPGMWACGGDWLGTTALIARGATVLAWRRT